MGLRHQGEPLGAYMKAIVYHKYGSPELIEAKKLTPVIDRRYTLSEVPEAIRYSEQGHARGKVVITLEDEGNDNEHHHRRVTT